MCSIESISSTDDDDEVFRKKKKPRTAFSRDQVAELEKKFTERKYLSSAERGELAEKLKLSDMQVKTWFQNRRMKYKRQTEEAELENKSPKFPYTPLVPYSSLYNYMHYKASDTMPGAYGYNIDSCRPPSTADSFPSNHFSSQISPNYFTSAAGVAGGHSASAGHFTPLSPASNTSPSCYHVGSYITTGDYNMISSIPYNVDWHRSLPTPPAP